METQNAVTNVIKLFSEVEWRFKNSRVLFSSLESGVVDVALNAIRGGDLTAPAAPAPDGRSHRHLHFLHAHNHQKLQ